MSNKIKPLRRQSFQFFTKPNIPYNPAVALLCIY